MIGAFEPADADVVEQLHAGIDAPVVRADVASAEMIKLAANAALVTRISFINEIANVCEATGADVLTVAEGIGLDRRIGPSFLRAGIGYGGSCFPKDSLALKQLAANSGYSFQLLNAVIEVNELQKRRVVGKLEGHLGSLRGKKVAILGLAFKPGTDDMREAPSLVLAARLLAEGAEVSAWDPSPTGMHSSTASSSPTAARGARRGRRGGDRDRVARAGRARLGRGWEAHAEPRARGRTQHARPGEAARARLRVRGDRAGLGVSLPAVILVGGQGTRLRPLTERIRKDMLPLVDRPLLAFTFEHLRRHGVRRGIVSCGYLPTQIKAHFGSGYGDLDLEYRVEEEPLGTAGGIAFAAEGIDETFFALNGDSLRDADLGEIVRFHRETGAKATILLTPVADPSRYGLVRLAPDGRVSTFLEKPRPEEIDTNLINAGVYVLEPEVLSLIPADRAVSIERDVFPRLAEEGSVYGLALEGYWLDVGTPEAYLQAHRDVLERSFATETGDALGPDFMLVDESAQVHPGARLVPPVYVGPGAVVEDGAQSRQPRRHRRRRTPRARTRSSRAPSSAHA